MFTQFASSHPQAAKRQLEGFIAKSLLDYESRNIDKKHPEIRIALRESDENYLVKEITRQKIELPAINDRAGFCHLCDRRQRQMCIRDRIKRRQSKLKKC